RRPVLRARDGDGGLGGDPAAPGLPAARRASPRGDSPAADAARRREPVHERLSASARRVRAGHAGAGRHPAPPRAGGPPGARRGRLRGRRGRAGGAPPVRRGSPARGSGPGGPGRAGAWVGAPAGGWLLPTMSALLLAASHPPASVLPFALVGLVPMAVRVARLSAGPGGGSAAFRSGLLFGAVHHALL